MSTGVLFEDSDVGRPLRLGARSVCWGASGTDNSPSVRFGLAVASMHGACWLAAAARRWPRSSTRPGVVFQKTAAGFDRRGSLDRRGSAGLNHGTSTEHRDVLGSSPAHVKGADVVATRP